MSLDTAVKLTKFLHGKGTPKSELIQVASDVVYERTKIYLPQKHGVIFEWLVERMHNSKEWRVDCQSWAMLRQCWISIGDAESKTRIYAKYDFMGLVSAVLGDLADSDGAISGNMHTIQAEIASTIHEFNKDVVWVRPTTDVGYQLVGNFLMTCIQDENENLSEQVLPLVKRILSSSPTKKQLAFFCNKVFVSSLVLSSMDVSKTVSHLIDIIFSEFLNFDNDNISEYVKTAKDKCENEEAVTKMASRLFKAVVLTKSKDAAKLFNQLATTCPDSTFQLLRIAVEHSVRLSQDDLNNLVKRHLSISTDWKLLHLILNLNSDVIFSVSDQVFEKVDHSAECVEFLQVMIQAYANSREFTGFFEKWSELVFANSIWQDERIVEEVVVHLRQLSSTQLGALLDNLMTSFNESDDHKSKKLKKEERPKPNILPSIAVAKGLLQSSNSVIDRLHDNLQAMLSSNALDDPKIWRLKYLVLSINSEFVQAAQKTIPSQVAACRMTHNDPPEHWQSLLQVVFRMREFYDVEFFDELVTRNLDYINDNSNVAAQCLSTITKRWLILANAHFGEQHLTLLSQLYLNHPPALLELVQNPLFFEQRAFVNEMIHEMIRQLETADNNEDSADIITALNHFPIEVFSQYLRQKLLDLLVQNYKQSISVLKTLTQRPTYSSRIETEIDLLCEIASKMPTEDVFTITKQIVQNHVRNIESNSSSKYITKLVKKLLQLMKKPQEWSLQFATVVVDQIGDDLLDNVSAKVLEGFLKIIDNFKTEQTAKSLDRLIQRVSNEQLISKASVAINDKLSASISNKNDNLAGDYFSILCRVYPTGQQNAVFITSRFIYLYSEGFNTIGEAYSQYMKRSGSVETILQNLVTECFVDSDRKANIDPTYAEAIRINSLLLAKGQESNFVQVLSFITEQVDRLDHEGLAAVLLLMDSALKAQTLISQYVLELIITFVCKVQLPSGPEFICTNFEGLYVALTHVASSVLLFHRHRLNGRYHLVMEMFQVLLRSISDMPNNATDRAPWMANSVVTGSCAIAYSRLLGNLCEPPVAAIREKRGANDLNSSSTLAKKELSKHLYVLMHSYVQLSLQSRFTSQVKSHLRPGFYPVFDVIKTGGSDRLKMTNELMDSSGRALFRTLYEDYQKNGKWREE